MNININYKSSFSNAQIEVWEMKDKIYESVKHLSLKDALYQIMVSSQIMTEKFLKERKIKIN